MSDTWEDILADVAEVYGYREDERPQSRAHAYIERRRVVRGFNDTALQVAAMDLCRRAYELGRASDVADPERIAAELAETGGRLLKAACELRSL